MIGRTVLMDEADARPAPFVAYATAAMVGMDAQPLETLLQGDASWPTP